MSIIIYGPQGCGKSLYAERFRQFFKMESICDDEMDPYPLTTPQQEEFKAGKVLFLTCIDPKLKDYDTRYGDYDTRRVIPFKTALAMLKGLK